jgi:predicted DNA-binding transcriptional regulator YafY
MHHFDGRRRGDLQLAITFHTLKPVNAAIKQRQAIRFSVSRLKGEMESGRVDMYRLQCVSAAFHISLKAWNTEAFAHNIRLAPA